MATSSTTHVQLSRRLVEHVMSVHNHPRVKEELSRGEYHRRGFGFTVHVRDMPREVAQALAAILRADLASLETRDLAVTSGVSRLTVGNALGRVERALSG